MKRLFTGLAIGTGWLLLLLYGSSMLFWLVVSAAGALALHEYFVIALKEKTAIALRPYLVLTAALPFLAAIFGSLHVVTAALFLAFFCLVLLTLLAYARLADPFAFLVRAAFAALYVGFCAAHLPLIFHLVDGARLIILLTIIMIASDGGAFYVGSTLGRRKLCPSVSPNKTVEGLAGGLTSGVVAALAAGFVLFPDTSPLQLAVVAFILSSVGAVGDLAESVIKRAMGVKDSGTLLPGHGGILDRADSMLLTAPLLYYLLILGFF